MLTEKDLDEFAEYMKSGAMEQDFKDGCENDRENGREAWVNSDLLYRRPSAPIRIGATVAVADFEGYVTMFNPATGEIVGRTSLDSAVTTPASQYGYGAVFQTVDGEVAYVVQEQLAE